MSAAKAAGSKAADAKAAARDAIDGDTVTLSSSVTRGGRQVIEPVTFQVPNVADLPRTLRRRIRQAQVKYAAPARDDRSGGRLDLFSLAFEVGEAVAAHQGVHLDLDSDALPAAEADAQDAVITSLGMRVLASQVQGGEAEPKNADDQAEADQG